MRAESQRPQRENRLPVWRSMKAIVSQHVAPHLSISFSAPSASLRETSQHKASHPDGAKRGQIIALESFGVAMRYSALKPRRGKVRWAQSRRGRRERTDFLFGDQ